MAISISNDLEVMTVQVPTGPQVLTLQIPGVQGAQGPVGPVGPGVPSGGTAGQLLFKIDGADYNTSWVTATNLATGDTIVKRAAGGGADFTNVHITNTGVPALNAATRRDYVDAQDKKAIAVWRSVDTSNTSAGYWWKVGTATLSLQYNDVNLTLLVEDIGNGNAANNYAEVTMRVKQQNAFPAAPFIEVLVSGISNRGAQFFSADDFVALITSSAGPTTVDLYVRVGRDYSTAHVYELSYLTTGTATFTYAASGQAGISALPAGTQAPGVLAPTEKDVAEAGYSATANTLVKRDAAGNAELKYLRLTSAATQPGEAIRKNEAEGLRRVARTSFDTAVTAAYTLTLADEGKSVEAYGTPEATITIPAEATANFPIGAWVEINSIGAIMNIVGATGVTIRKHAGAEKVSPYGSVRLRKVAADTWQIDGHGYWTHAAVNNSIMRRDADGTVGAAGVYLGTQSSLANSATRKDYVDGIGTANSAANTIMRRDQNNYTAIGHLELTAAQSSATAGSRATRKDFVEGLRRIERPAPVTANYTLALSDEGVARDFDVTTASVTVTIPDNATVAFPVGSWLYIGKAVGGSNTVTIVGATGVTVVSSTSLVLRTDRTRVRLHKISTDAWQVDGDDSTASNFANTLVRRSSSGSVGLSSVFGLGTPTADNHAANKAYVDALGTPDPTANTVARRNASGEAAFKGLYLENATTASNHATRKDYVDGIRRVVNVGFTASLTLALTDEGKMLSNGSATAATTVTIPTNAAVAFPIGSFTDILRYATHAVTIKADTGVDLVWKNVQTSAGSISVAQHQVIRVHKVSTNLWYAYELTVDQDVSGAVAGAGTANTLVRRTSNGSVVGAHVVIENSPTSTVHAVRKDYADALGTDQATANTIVRRNANGHSLFTQVYATDAAPTQAGQLTRKDYVDNAVLDPDTLASGEASMQRYIINSTLTLTSQNLRLAYFTAKKTETITKIVVSTGGTAAGATPTLVRFGLYTVAANGDLTLVASTANDTTLLSAASTVYTVPLSASYNKVAGTRYALGALVVTAATAPNILSGGVGAAGAALALNPRLSGTINGQADLPASLLGTNISNFGQQGWLAVTP